jgi:putative ABC transport system ATP-binding protein
MVAGQRLDGLDEDALALMRRRSVGIVFQSFHLIPTMTALENVAVPLELAGRRDAFEAARAALDAVGLGKRVRHFPSQLSGGEQQRTALCRALLLEPPLVLADEPTGSLDPAAGTVVFELLLSLQRRHGATVLLVTHNPGLAGRCARILQLEDGLLRDGSL